MSRTEKIEKAEEEWKKELSQEQYHVLREAGTEPPFSGEFWNEHRSGMYRCAACGQELFSSETKFDSGSGWPSFFTPVAKERVFHGQDASHGTERTEIRCSRCGSHLGHVFDDGPKPTGKRYCINSLALGFNEKNE